MNTPPKVIDGAVMFEQVLVSALGLDSYAHIVRRVWETDVRRDPVFQKFFNRFFRVRRNQQWREQFYRIFEEAKPHAKEITFERILLDIYNSTGRTEASFASKLLASVNPDKPIWDSKVLAFFGLKPPLGTVGERHDAIVKIYGEIEDWYQKYLPTSDARKNLDIFNRQLPHYTWLSNVKKIDFMIWSNRNIRWKTPPSLIENNDRGIKQL